MKSSAKIAITLLVVAAAATAFVLKEMKSRDPVTESAPSAPVAGAKLPKLLDLGAGKCVPCKAMVPVLEELEKEYAGKMIVEFIDVWKNEDAGKRYGVDIIPTQIFFDAEGKELFRHTGFFGKEDILAKWKELGVEF